MLDIIVKSGDNPAQIDWNFEELKNELSMRLEKYRGLVFTEENVADAKADRASLNKLKAAFDDKRREIKKQILKPLEDFEAKVKELTALIDAPIREIDSQIQEYENKKKEEKRSRLIAYHGKIIGDLAKVVPIDSIWVERWLNASMPINKAMEEIAARVEQIKSGLESLSGLKSEFETEIKAEFLKAFRIEDALKKKETLEHQKRQFDELREKKEREQEAKRIEQERKNTEKEVVPVNANPVVEEKKEPVIEQTEPVVVVPHITKTIENVFGGYFPYSISKINTFDCPQKFFWRYVKKLPEEKSAAAEKGLKIHDAIAKALESEQYDKEYEYEVRAALSYIGDRIVNQVENRFAIKEDFSSVEFFDNSGYFRGVIDCVAEKEVIDWKSGFGQQDYTQIQVYGYILEKLGMRPDILTLYYLRKRAADSIPYDSRQGREAFERLQQQIKIIETYKEEKQFNANPSPRCSYCGYKRICKANDLGYPELKDSQTLLITLEQVEMEKIRIKGIEEAVKSFVLDTGITCINESGEEYRPYESKMLRISDNDKMAFLVEALGIDPDTLKAWDTAKVKLLLEKMEQPGEVKGIYKTSISVRVGWVKPEQNG